MSEEKKLERPVFDLGMTDTVIEDVPSEPPAHQDILELVERIRPLRMTRPIEMVFERIKDRAPEDLEWAKMDEQLQNCVLVLFTVQTAALRDNVRALAENAT